jgi:hypothetical protein
MTRKLTIFAVAAGAFVGFSTAALAQYGYEPRAPRRDVRYDDAQAYSGGGKLDYEFDRLNGMFAHVERELQRYGANRHIWWQYRHLRDEFRQLNWQFRRGDQYNRKRQMRDELAHVRGELHRLEVELRVRPGEWYQWR